MAEKAGKRKREYKLSMITERTIEKIKSLAEGPIEAVFTDSAYGKVNYLFYLHYSNGNFASFSYVKFLFSLNVNYFKMA